MIVVTGGAGFIGSALVWRLNQLGRNDIMIVDQLGTDDKWKNLVGLDYEEYSDKDEFLDILLNSGFSFPIDAILHMGANSATTEKDADHLMSNNYRYTQLLADYCIENNTRFVYASSAATYGDGSLGFIDDDSLAAKLRPLNMYGYSKNLFDIYANKRGIIKQIAGVKFFNVFGPNEYHKGDMRSVVVKAFEQIQSTGKVQLFKSLHPDYKDGEQMRDFVYVKDAVEQTLFLMNTPNANGLFNVGTGKARTWIDLVTAIFTALGKNVNIEFIDLPEQLKNKYQYYTQAPTRKIEVAGYSNGVTTLEDAVTDYVVNYLVPGKYLNND